MNEIIVSEKRELEQLMREAFREEAKAIVPEIVRKATEKPYLTKEELMELTGWSERTIQSLRSNKQIPYSKHGYKILYPRQGIMDWLEANSIQPKK